MIQNNFHLQASFFASFHISLIKQKTVTYENSNTPIFIFLSSIIKSQNKNFILDSSITLGGKSDPLIFLNSKSVKGEIFSSLKEEELGAVVIVGDSVYMKRRKQKSILQKYYGPDIAKGAILIFTKTEVENLSLDDFKKYLHVNTVKSFWYVNSQPLIENYNVTDFTSIKSIQLIRAAKFRTIDNKTDIRNIVILTLSNN